MADGVMAVGVQTAAPANVVSVMIFMYISDGLLVEGQFTGLRRALDKAV